MKESIKIFSDKNIKKLEDDVGEFLNDPRVVFINGQFSLTGTGAVLEYAYLVRFDRYGDEEISPKDKAGYKYGKFKPHHDYT